VIRYIQRKVLRFYICYRDRKKSVFLFDFCIRFHAVYKDLRFYNTTMAYEKDDCAKTSMTLDWGARKFTIAPVEGNQSLVPESRMYCVEFGGSTAKEAKVFVNGVEADAEVKEKDGLLTIFSAPQSSVIDVFAQSSFSYAMVVLSSSYRANVLSAPA